MNSLRDRIPHDKPSWRQPAFGSFIGDRTPPRLVVVDVSSDVAQARRVLVARYGNVVLVQHANPAHTT